MLKIGSEPEEDNEVNHCKPRHLGPVSNKAEKPTACDACDACDGRDLSFELFREVKRVREKQGKTGKNREIIAEHHANHCANSGLTPILVVLSAAEPLQPKAPECFHCPSSCMRPRPQGHARPWVKSRPSSSIGCDLTELLQKNSWFQNLLEVLAQLAQFPAKDLWKSFKRLLKLQSDCLLFLFLRRLCHLCFVFCLKDTMKGSHLDNIPQST